MSQPHYLRVVCALALVPALALASACGAASPAPAPQPFVTARPESPERVSAAEPDAEVWPTVTPYTDRPPAPRDAGTDVALVPFSFSEEPIEGPLPPPDLPA